MSVISKLTGASFVQNPFLDLLNIGSSNHISHAANFGTVAFKRIYFVYGNGVGSVNPDETVAGKLFGETAEGLVNDIPCRSGVDFQIVFKALDNKNFVIKNFLQFLFVNFNEKVRRSGWW